MALPTIKRASEVIDLTVDDDDGDQQPKPAALPSPLTNSHGRPVLHPNGQYLAAVAPNEPPAKRVKLSEGSHYAATVASVAVRAFAQAGASQAAREDFRVQEAVLRSKVCDALPISFRRGGSWVATRLTE